MSKEMLDQARGAGLEALFEALNPQKNDDQAEGSARRRKKRPRENAFHDEQDALYDERIIREQTLEIATLRSNIKDHQAEIKSLNDKVKSLNDKVRQQRNRTATTCAQRRADKANFNEEINKQKNKLTDLTVQVASERAHKNEAQETVKQLEKERDERDAEIARLEQLLDQSRFALQQVQIENRQWQHGLGQDYQSRITELARKNSEVETLQAENSKQKSELEQMGTELEWQRVQTRDAQREIDELKKAKARAETRARELEQFLDDLYKKLNHHCGEQTTREEMIGNGHARILVQICEQLKSFLGEDFYE